MELLPHFFHLDTPGVLAIFAWAAEDTRLSIQRYFKFGKRVVYISQFDYKSNFATMNKILINDFP